MEKIKNKEKLNICSNEYMFITNEIIKFLHEDNLEEAENLVEEREKIIENIKKLNCSSEEFLDVFNNKEFMDLENKCAFLIKEKLQFAKEKLTQLKNSKNANKNYSKYANKSFAFLNKKV